MLLVCASTGWLPACASSQFTTATVYETPTAFVRLEFDRTVEKGREHSHPLTLAPERMGALLSGLIFEEPLAKLPLYDDTSQPRRHRVLSDKEVAFWAPLLSIALAKATPEEVVTFYQSERVSGTRRDVTSGGLFVQGREVHLLLANYRSPTHYNADIGVADTQDDRLTPMRPLAPQRGRLDFEPRSAMREQSPGFAAKFFQWERREVIILYETLQPVPLAPSAQLPASPITVPPSGPAR